jgi:hypothetical protein
MGIEKKELGKKSWWRLLQVFTIVITVLGSLFITLITVAYVGNIQWSEVNIHCLNGHTIESSSLGMSFYSPGNIVSAHEGNIIMTTCESWDSTSPDKTYLPGSYSLFEDTREEATSEAVTRTIVGSVILLLFWGLIYGARQALIYIITNEL